MRISDLLIRGFVVSLMLAMSARMLATDVLFVGNSFTHTTISPASRYNAGAITDANGSGYGGVPGIFRKLCEEGGITDVNVTIEAVGGQTLAYHLANKLVVIDRAWDVVVLQDYSTRPLPGHSSGDVAGFRDSVRDLAALLRNRNPAVRIYLYETWARPDQVPSPYATLQNMQTELHDSYSAAALDYALSGWVPVGDSFLRALEQGIAYDPDAGTVAGKMNLWAADNYHASSQGCYLSAMLFYAAIFGNDPVELPEGPGSAAAGLGLSDTDATSLQALAAGMVGAPVGMIKKSPQSRAVFPGTTITLKVAASGATGYQWRYNGIELAGETAASLTLGAVRRDQAGRYDVVVSFAGDETETSAAAVLTVTDHSVSRRFFVDLGAAAAGYTAASPDIDGRFWNQFQTVVAPGARTSPLIDKTGVVVPGAYLELGASFSGANTSGVVASTLYPAEAQRDSLFVTGTGTVGTAIRGELVLGGVGAGVRVTAKVFGSRVASSGARVGRYTLGAGSPVYLDATNNTNRVAILGPESTDAAGRVSLVVEPYDSSGALQEYAYLGVLELIVDGPAPTAYEMWASSHGLTAEAAEDSADPDCDGVANLIEFALASDPASAVSKPSVVTSLWHDAADARYLLLEAQKSLQSDSTLLVEVSSNLETWSSDPADVVILEQTSTFIRARDAHPISELSGRFMRLRAEPALIR